MAFYTAEHTDTFAREANYSWVTRKVIQCPENASDRQIVKKAKEALGMTGVKCDREILGDEIILRPRGICQIIFINWIAVEYVESFLNGGVK